jgi:NAD(P)-dependent dehydrogenase (short-subunit alcohol dehydrogenase family)
MTELAGQVALVTGGTSGIGEAVSRALTAQGVQVGVLSNAPRTELEAALARGDIAAAEQLDLADVDKGDIR